MQLKNRLAAIRSHSLEYILLMFFMTLYFVDLWVIQILWKVPDRRIYQERFLGIAALILIIAAIVKACRTKHIGMPNISTCLLIAMAVLTVLSTIFGRAPKLSIEGSLTRCEGMIAILSYYVFGWYGLRVKDAAERHRLVCCFVVIGALSALTGIATGLGYMSDENINMWGDTAAIPFGNPNLYGSFICMVDAVGMAMVIYGSRMRTRVAGAAVLLLASLATFCCDSSSPLVGNIMAVLAVLCMEVWTCVRESVRVGRLRRHDTPKSPIRIFAERMAALLVCLIIYFAAMFTVNEVRGGAVTDEWNDNMEDVSRGLFDDSMFDNRMGIWKYLWSKLPDCGYFGVGPDNMHYITILSSSEYTRGYDKAHNEYLNIAVCEGIFTAICYIVFLFTLFIPAIAHWRERSHSWAAVGLFLIFFSYIAQAFFNIRVIQVAPFFWVLCGLLGAEGTEQT